MKLLALLYSPKPGKKYVAIFQRPDGSRKEVYFGATGFSDYLLHRDPLRRAAYLERHGKSGRERWDVPDTPASLSRWLLWGPTTSLRTNLALFRRRFQV